MSKNRIDEVGTLGNIAGLAAGAKGAWNGATSGKGAFGKIAGAWQGAKEGSAKKKGAWAVKQWAKKLKVDFLRHSGAAGDTPEAFKNFIDSAYKIDLSLPPSDSAAPAATAQPQASASPRPSPRPASVPPHAFGGSATPASTSFGGDQYTNQTGNASVGPSFKAKTTLNQPYPQQYQPAASQPSAPAPAPAAASAYAGNFGGGYNQTVSAPLAAAPAASPAAVPSAPAAPRAPLSAAPAAANKPRMSSNAMDAISAMKNLGYNSKQATAAVAGAATDPTMSTQSIISAALKSMAPAPAVAAESAISPSLGLYGDKSFSQLLSEGVILTEDTIDDWCLTAAKQLLAKYPWLLDASVKYKVGSPEFAEYLQKMHDDNGYDFGTQPTQRSPSVTSPTAPPSQNAANPSPGAAPPVQVQQPTMPLNVSTKINTALRKCGLSPRLAPKVQAILKDAENGKAGNFAALTSAFNKIGIRDEKAIIKLVAAMSL